MARSRSGQEQQLLLPAAAAALLCAACAFGLSVADGGESKVFFFEPFDEHYESRWTVSKDPAYEGKWVYEKAEGLEDYGLVVSEKAKKYAIAAALPQPAELMKEPVVLQYEVRAQKGMDCGGAYLKFLMPQEAGWAPEDLKDSSPYSIMFGPDKCGATNKVHFIFRHKNPKTREYVEHHLASPPVPRTEWVTHVYTAVVYPNNTVRVLVNGEAKASADMLSYKDFVPPVLLPKTIPDPDDKKPEDWDERPKIADPDAEKPDDWDENAPREILDEDAKKPEGWLDDEPLEVDDPEASKPEDWDDDEDGEWEPPKVPNPKCDEAPGCGEWKRPMKKNPAYKGKWSAPLIENPAYKGIWKPRDIPNPEYFELEKPALEPIAAVGIEIWTMNDGVLFDNILITNDEALAEEYRNTKWKPKYDREKEIQKEKQKKEEEEKKKSSPKASDKFKDKVFDLLYRIADAPVFKNYKKEVTDLIERGEDRPEVVYALIVLFFFGVVLIIYSILPGKKTRRARARVTVEQAKKEDITGADDPAPAAPAAEAAAEPAAEPAAETAAAEEPSTATSAAEPSAPVAAAVEDKAEEEEESGGAKVRRRTRRDT